MQRILQQTRLIRRIASALALGKTVPFLIPPEWRTPGDCRLKIASFEDFCGQIGSHVTAWLPRSGKSEKYLCRMSSSKGEWLAFFEDSCTMP
jgi:hypothetical protein